MSTRALALLILLTLACTLPFIAKPFHVDEPLFLWTAEQIRTSPLDPYDFSVNWYHHPEPMDQVTCNPPLASYYAALVTTVAGWSEVALHLCFILPALALVVGTYVLAARLTKNAFAAAALTLFAPVFLITGASVTCDMLMSALVVWATVFWIRGRNLPACILLIAAMMTKYSAAAVLPALAVYALTEQPRRSRRLLWLLPPLAAPALFLFWSGYAVPSEAVSGSAGITRVIVGLSFLGGCLAPLLFLSPVLWRRLALALGVACMAALAVVLHYACGYSWAVSAQLGIWMVCGLGALALAVRGLCNDRSAGMWMLATWVFGTFVFAAFFTWTATARYMLPLVPAIGILAARRLKPERLKLTYLALVPAAVLAMACVWSDYTHAVSAREAVRRIDNNYDANQVTFQGHWGFQYYMQQRGAQALDIDNQYLAPGSILVQPISNTNLIKVPDWFADPIEVLTAPKCRWLALMDERASAGFYAADCGPLAFSFGSIPPDGYRVLKVRR